MSGFITEIEKNEKIVQTQVSIFTSDCMINMSKSMDFFEKFFCKLPKLQFLRISRAMKFHETPTSIAIYVVSGFTFNASLFFFAGQIYKSGRVCACAK